jgi:uncharacterized protein involved in exopolysaccharide biosynthesis
MATENEMLPPPSGTEKSGGDAEARLKFDLEKFILLIWSKRKRELQVIAGATLLAVIISLLLPNYYKSSAVILPQTDEGGLAALASLSGLASAAGINVGQVTIEELFPDIISSESVLKDVLYAKYATKKFAHPVDLITYWDIEGTDSAEIYELALKRLRKELDVSQDRKTDVVTVSILTKEPQLSADIVNNVTAGLDLFLRTKKKTNASEQREWIETRLAEVNADLAKSEDALKNFREENRQVGDSPALLLEQTRLMRNVDINTTLFTTLKQQYELARIEEVKNIPIVNIMDAARPAGKKDKPRRSIIVISVFLISIIGTLGCVYLMDRYDAEITRMVSLIAKLRRM